MQMVVGVLIGVTQLKVPNGKPKRPAVNMTAIAKSNAGFVLIDKMTSNQPTK